MVIGFLIVENFVENLLKTFWE